MTETLNVDFLLVQLPFGAVKKKKSVQFFGSKTIEQPESNTGNFRGQNS
jgi:hypothetical protein